METLARVRTTETARAHLNSGGSRSIISSVRNTGQAAETNNMGGRVRRKIQTLLAGAAARPREQRVRLDELVVVAVWGLPIGYGLKCIVTLHGMAPMREAWSYAVR